MKNFQFSIFNFQNKEQSGFTIVEVLVTSLIFSIIAISVSSIFIQIINLQRRAFSVQKIQDNALLVLEEMSRDLRVSRISNQESANCTATTLTINHPLKGTIIYQLSSGIVQRNTNDGGFVDISSSDVNFTRMNFCILGSLSNDNQSQRTTVVTSIRNRTGREVLEINIQTTVSSRDVFDEFQNP